MEGFKTFRTEAELKKFLNKPIVELRKRARKPKATRRKKKKAQINSELNERNLLFE